MSTRLKVRFGFGGNKAWNTLSPRSRDAKSDTHALPDSLEEVPSSAVFKKTTTAALKELLGDIHIEAVFKGSSGDGDGAATATTSTATTTTTAGSEAAAVDPSLFITEPKSSSAEEAAAAADSGKIGPVALYIRLVYTALRVSVKTILRRLGLQPDEGASRGISIAESMLTPRHPGKIDTHSFNVEKLRDSLADFFVVLHHQYDAEKKILFCSLAEKGIGTMHWQLLRDELMAKLQAVGDLVEYCHQWRLLKHKLRQLTDEYKALELQRPSPAKSPLSTSNQELLSASTGSLVDRKRQTLPRSATSLLPRTVRPAASALGGELELQPTVVDVEERLFWLNAEISEAQFLLKKLQHATRSIYHLRTQITHLFSLFSVEMLENLHEQEQELLLIVQSNYSVAEECDLLRKILSVSNSHQILRSTPWIIRHLPTPPEQSYFLRLMDSILPFRFYDVCLGLESILPPERKQQWERSLQIRLPRLSFVRIATPLHGPLHLLELFGVAIHRGLQATLDIISSSSPFRWTAIAELADVFRIVPIYLMQKGMCVFPLLERRLYPAPLPDPARASAEWPAKFSPLASAEHSAPSPVPSVCLPFMQQHRIIFQHAKTAYAGLQQLRSEPSTLAACVKATQETLLLFAADQQLEKTVLSPLYDKHFSREEQGSLLRECLGLPPFVFHDEMMPFIISRLDPDQRKDLVVCLALSLPKAQLKLYLKRISEKVAPDTWQSIDAFLQATMPRRKSSSSSSSSSSTTASASSSRSVHRSSSSEGNGQQRKHRSSKSAKH